MTLDPGAAPPYSREVADWLTIEVFDGAFPASQWRRAHDDTLVQAAVSAGAVDWTWHRTRWGVVLELRFGSEEALERFRASPALRAVLDAVPDREAGLLVYRGQGGGAGATLPRRPHPAPACGAAALPDPPPPRLLDLAGGREHRPDLLDARLVPA